MSILPKRKTLILVSLAGAIVILALVAWGTNAESGILAKPASIIVSVVNFTPDPVKENIPAPDPNLATFVEIINSCGPYFDGDLCVSLRSGPGSSYDIVKPLRNGMVLRVGEKVEAEGREWYPVVFTEWLRYPERASGKFYVAAEYVKEFKAIAGEDYIEGLTPPTTKHIEVDRSEQMLYAYDGDSLFMQQPISTGLDLTPTPRGSFHVYRKTPGRYMQGPLPEVSDQYYDLPGVPWNLYFTKEGGVIHGAYWHDRFGEPWSHGCVNLPPDKARELYEWADIGTPVVVRD